MLCQTGINTPQFALLGPPHWRPPAPPPWKHNSRLLNSPLSGPERPHCPGEERAGLGPRTGLQRDPAPDSAARGSASAASFPGLGNLGQRASVSPWVLRPEPLSSVEKVIHYRAAPALKVVRHAGSYFYTGDRAQQVTWVLATPPWEQGETGERGEGGGGRGEGKGRAQPRIWNKGGFKLHQGHLAA